MKRFAGPGLRIAALLVVAVFGCTAAACGSSGSGGASPTAPATVPFAASYTHVGPFTILRSSSRSPGAVLMQGLVVPDGSDVLGTVFPDATGKGGFLALGVVTGDPVAVFNAYVDQASALGMTVTNGEGCSIGPTSMTCVRTLTDPGDGEQLSIRIERRPAPPGYVSHIALQYRVPGSINVASMGPPSITPPTSPVPARPLPAAIAFPSDESWNLSVDPAGPGLQLVPGSYLVGPPGPCGCSASGWSAVLRVTGDPASVLAKYASQLTPAPVTPIRRTVDGASAEVANLGLVVGGFTQLRLVSQSGVTYLMIAVAHL